MGRTELDEVPRWLDITSGVAALTIGILIAGVAVGVLISFGIAIFLGG